MPPGPRCPPSPRASSDRRARSRRLLLPQTRRGLPELDAAAFDGYVAGLRDAGWRGDPRLVRLGCDATMALRLGPLLGVVQALTATPEQRTATERAFGEPLEAFFDRYAAVQRFVLARAEGVRGNGPLV